MPNRRRQGPAQPTSPSSSGPAGSEFEAQVGASYLLTMLTGSEPRGLPGTVIQSVALQRAAEGNPLDDIVIEAHDTAGNLATLEIQVKRSITFTASDPVFAVVVAQMAEAARQPGFWDTKHELAVATARTSRKVEGAYQDVLTWARQIGDGATFAARIARPHSANDDMRAFVNTFKSRLQSLNFPHDDETVWKLLRRFQILVFDFAATGSASDALARERSSRALEPADTARGGELWAILIRLALSIAAAGGDRNRQTLRAEPDLGSFNLVREPRHRRALAALAENADQALRDIRDQIGSVSIARPARIAEVHAALGQGRYVEIRGDAGVGKSGILKHFAMQAASEHAVVVLSPGRTIPRGWTALRAILPFEGTARDLLIELAADGTAILFIDNLDLFSPEEQATANDLVREASNIPGFSVVVTARRAFGTESPTWLPQDALDQFGRSPAIVINELDDEEVEEIEAVAPALGQLLSPSHPAKDVTRNLFRLARLATRAQDAPSLSTEIGMADEWWETADGSAEGRRGRARVLRSLAEQALGTIATFDTSAQPPEAVDALIQSEALRDYGDDRVGFRHDVLREWAIYKLLASDAVILRRLPLSQPAPAYLARGVELYARSLIERAENSQAWSGLLADLSGEDIHGSWRRAVLLSLARSEAAARSLRTAMPNLTANNGALLNELIRTIMAVDVQPARNLFEGSAIDVNLLPPNFVVPSGPSWSRLIVWLLSLGDTLPDGSISDIVDLFNRWALSMLGMDPLTPRLMTRLYEWLTRLEAAHSGGYFRERQELFGGTLSSDQLRSLMEDLRRYFVMFANRVPALAAEYLRTLRSQDRLENAALGLHEFYGTLPAAAPQELADFIQAALIPVERPDRPSRQPRSSRRERGFTFFDNQFLPVSPAQGPFFELLNASPEIGKGLIRRLVDHAISVETEGFAGTPPAIEITLPAGVRRFTWPHTYMWSREMGASYYAVSSGLMALEAWAHARIEAGETVEVVIADLIGTEELPSAYLLIVVSVLLSHAPASGEAAIPYAASPELIIQERERHVHERIEFPDILGIRALQREPGGRATLRSLNDRPSRRCSLYDMLAQYAINGTAEQRERLTTLLQGAIERLGPPSPDSNFGNPELMALHALNLINPANWQAAQVQRPDGSIQRVRQYVAPQQEAEHMAPFQRETQERQLEVTMQQAASTLLEAPGRAGPEALTALLEWAMPQPLPVPVADNNDGEGNTAWVRGEILTNIAMIVMRDGNPELRQRARDWAHGVFAHRLSQPINRATGHFDRLQYNPLAISFAGLAFSLRDRADEADIRQVLQIAGHESSAAAHGFAASAKEIAAIDPRLLKSILRCAFKSTIYCRRNWEVEEADYEARKAELRQEVDAAIEQELSWLFGRRDEPSWPDFPLSNPSPRRGIRLPGGDHELEQPPRERPEEHADSRSAAKWLSAIKGAINNDVQRSWARDLISHYRAWTGDANGAALDDDIDVDSPTTEWNNAYFDLAATCLFGLEVAEIDTFVLDLIISVSPNAFLGISASFIRSVDVIYFDTETVSIEAATHIRTRLSQALREHNAWPRFTRDRSTRVETHMGDAISAFFFHVYNHGFSPPHCYVTPNLIQKLRPLLGSIETLAVEAPTIISAAEIMGLLEVSPQSAHLPFGVAAARAWVTLRPDDTTFWIDYSIGRKFCHWLDKLRQIDPTALQRDTPLRSDIDRILVALVRVGVTDAVRLEAQL